MTDTVFDKGSCDECGSTTRRCPECGSTFVTPLEPQDRRPTITVEQFVQAADDGDSMAFTNMCWDCGWEDEREITVRLK